MKKTKLLFVLLSVSLLVIFSCSDDSTGPDDDEEEIDLAENTTIMNETDLSYPVIEGDTYTYTYTGDPPEINEGDVIIGQLDNGYLRKVSSVEVTDDEIILETEQACLTDAVENASINDSILFTIGRGKFGPNTIPLYVDSLAKGVSIDRGTINLDNTTIFNGTVSGTELSVTITDGSVSFEPTLNRELEISWFTLEHLLLSTEGNLQFDCDLSLICDNTVSHSEEVTVASFSSPPFMLGPVPMVLELDFDAGYETELNMTGELTTGFDASSSVEYGAEYYNGLGWESIWNKSNEFNQHPVGWNYMANCYAKGYIQPKLNLQIASVAGPYFGLEEYLEFDGLIVIPNWQWELAAGINGNLGFEVEILSFELVDYYTTLANWETSIASDNGTITNNPPIAPSNPNPADNATSVFTNTDLSWECSDPDNDPLTYDVYFGTSSNPALANSGQSSTTYDPGTLNEETTYYWKIVAHDDHSNSTTGDIWEFTTAGGANQPPNPPTNPNPADNASSVSTNANLSWQCSDPENDPLTYDVYFGTSSNPSLVNSGQSGTTYDPGTLNEETTYYWKIVAHDDHSNSTTGDIWEFITAGSGNQPPNPPSNPNPAYNATSVSTTTDLSWECSDPDNDPLTYDVYFGTSSNPSLVNSGQSGTTYDPGTLNEETTYYWKILAHDDHSNTTTGDIWQFTTTGGGGTGTVTDIDGNVYQTLVIGDQEWMVENLKVTHYRNGDPIPNLTDDDDWTSTSSGAYCYYDNDPANGDTYGALYNWYAVDDSRNIAPEGWHVPTDEEIKELEMYLGMSQSQANSTSWRGTNEGSKLAGGYDLWSDGDLRNEPVFGSSGFDLLPGGYRLGNYGGFDYMGYSGYFWSATEYDSTLAWHRHLGYNYTQVNRSNYYKRFGFSVRCVRSVE